MTDAPSSQRPPRTPMPTSLPDPRLRVGSIGRRAWIALCSDWMTQDAAAAAWTDLREALPWEVRALTVKRLGHRKQGPVDPAREDEAAPRTKVIYQPRLMAWQGEVAYRYSGQTLEARPWTPAVQRLREAVEAATGGSFNHVVLNLYRDGKDHVRMHSDDELELGQDPLIASLSLGETRTFLMETRDKRRRQRTVRLTDGSLLVMGGGMQHTWRHAVLPEADRPGERINVTFRRVLEAPRTMA